MHSSTCTFLNVPSTMDGRFSAPAEEPLSVEELASHLRVDGPDESRLLGEYIAAARGWVENEINVSLGQRTIILYLDYFPEDGPVEVRFPPLQSVTSIVYLDGSGTSQTLSSTLYRVDAVSRPGRIEPAYGEVWPETYEGIKTITITAVVGYSTTASVPQCAKQAIRLYAGAMYQNREPTEVEYDAMRRILDPLRWEGRC